MTRLLILATLAASGAAAGFAECEPSTSPADLDTGATAEPLVGRHYVVEDCFTLGGPEVDGTIWNYREANGLDGLQRFDVVKDDTCGGEIEGDEIVL